MPSSVLSPWKPLLRSGSTVAHWNGKVVLGTPWPVQFRHGGKNLLTAPVRFVVRVFGGTEQEVTGALVLASQEDEKVTWSFAWSGNNLSASGAVDVHETGMVRCALTITPNGAQSIDRVRLEIPLNPQICEFLRDGSAQGNASLETPVPTWIDGQYNKPFTGTLLWKRFVSVANDDLGLQWCFSSDANHWSPSIKIVKTTGLATVELVGASRSVSTPFDYEFALSPLPCRPLVADWITSTRFGRRLDGGPERNRIEPLASDLQNNITYHGSLDPGCNLPAFESMLSERRAIGLRIIGYMSSQYWLDDEGNGYDSDWTNNAAPAAFGPNESIYKRCADPGEPSRGFRKVEFWQPGFQQFFLERVDREFDLDHFDGLYLDVHNTQRRANVVDTFGQERRFLPFADHRDWCKKIYARCENSGRILAGHPQHLFNARCHAHSHYVVIGEELSTGQPGGEFPCLSDFAPAQGSVPAGPTPDDLVRRHYYMNTLPIRYWRSVANSRVTGVAVVLIPEHFRTGIDGIVDSALRFPTENCLAMCRLHGVGFWKSFSHEATVNALYESEAVFGMADGSRFFGYWNAHCPVATDDPDAKVSAYRQGNRLLVYVVNFGDEDRPIAVQVKRGAGTPILRFTGTGLGDGSRSNTDPSDAFASDLDGAGDDFTVTVARENFVSVEVQLSGIVPVAAYNARRRRCSR